MSDFANDAEGGAEFGSWPELISFLLEHAALTGNVYRGMSSARYRCVTSMERALSEEVGQDEHERRRRLEQSALTNFRAVAGPQLPWRPDDDDLVSWLSIMQHYGAPTRLLDWSESPFVACYFAYSGIRPNAHEPAALWWMSAPAARLFAGAGDLPARNDFAPGQNPDAPWFREQNEALRKLITNGGTLVPWPVMPRNPDARMTAQQTLLTVDSRLAGGFSFPLEDPATSAFIGRIILPADWRTEVLTHLAVMGVTAASLFPGLGGIAQHTTMKVSLDQVGLRAHLENDAV